MRRSNGDLMAQTQRYNALNQLFETDYAADVTTGATNNGVQQTITYDADGHALATQNYYELGATITVQNNSADTCRPTPPATPTSPTYSQPRIKRSMTRAATKWRWSSTLKSYGNITDTVHVFAYNGSGEIIEREDGTATGGTTLNLGGNPNQEVQHYTYVNGQQLAHFDNAGTLDVLDQVTAFSSNNDSPDSYVVQTGDTLESIAQAEYGNANLWYVIAQANDLSSDTNLPLGQRLQIPAVTTHSNSATTFKPYDPTGIVGDSTPSLPTIAPPPPPVQGGGCSAAEILVIIVTVVVTIVTYGATSELLYGEAAALTASQAAVVGAVAGAAGSVAGQLTGMATGIQSGFNWGAVAEGAIGGAVGGAVTSGLANSGVGALTSDTSANGLSLLGDAVQGAATYLGNDAAGKLTDQPAHFSWAGLVASSVASVASGELGPTQADSQQGVTTGNYLDDLSARAVGDVVNREVSVALGDQHVPSWAQIGEDVAGYAIANPIGNDLTAAVREGLRADKSASSGNAPSSEVSSQNSAAQPYGTSGFSLLGNGISGASSSLFSPFNLSNSFSSDSPFGASSATGWGVLGSNAYSLWSDNGDASGASFGGIPSSAATIADGYSSAASTTTSASQAQNVTVSAPSGDIKMLPTIVVTPNEQFDEDYANLWQWAILNHMAPPPVTTSQKALNGYRQQMYAKTAPVYGQWSRETTLASMSPQARANYLSQEAYNNLTPDQQNAQFEQNFNAWREADTMSFLKFNGELALSGALAPVVGLGAAWLSSVAPTAGAIVNGGLIGAGATYGGINVYQGVQTGNTYQAVMGVLTVVGSAAALASGASDGLSDYFAFSKAPGGSFTESVTDTAAPVMQEVPATGDVTQAAGEVRVSATNASAASDEALAGC